MYSYVSLITYHNNHLLIIKVKIKEMNEMKRNEERDYIIIIIILSFNIKVLIIYYQTLAHDQRLLVHYKYLFIYNNNYDCHDSSK